MSQADWDRLQYYSRKVKFFSDYPDDTDLPIHLSTYFRIAQIQSSALFPSVRRLRYNLNDDSILYIFFFLSPLLDSLEIEEFSDLACVEIVHHDNGLFFDSPHKG